MLHPERSSLECRALARACRDKFTETESLVESREWLELSKKWIRLAEERDEPRRQSRRKIFDANWT